MSNKTIDFVITWVDDKDQKWIDKKSQYIQKQPEGFDGAERYRDWNTLKYWFRGVEKFAPWVNNIYFVSDDQKPEWLNINHPKLRWIKHTDYIPKEYLPTFNSNTIIWNLNKIKELSENFVLFNDDMFLIDDVRPEDFFINNIPCDHPQLIPLRNFGSFTHIMINNYSLCKRHFKLKKSFKDNFINWFRAQRLRVVLGYIISGRKNISPILRDWHIHCSYNKATFNELWNCEYDAINNTCLNKIRALDDVSDWCVRYWQIYSNNFHFKKSIGKYFSTSSLDESNELLKCLRKQTAKVVCINDTEEETNFEEHKRLVNEALESILPEKSSFEL